MRKKGYSIGEFTQYMEAKDIQSLMHHQHRKFMRRFGFGFGKSISVTLVFDDHYDAIDFYNELRFNRAYRTLYQVSMNPDNQRSVFVTGMATLFDYFGTREPNLLTASRDLSLHFTIEFVQDFSGTSFKGEALNGELLARQCILEVSTVLPELSLGGLCQIANTEAEFELLLTRIYPVEASILR